MYYARACQLQISCNPICVFTYRGNIFLLYYSFISFHSTSLKFNVENTIQKLIPRNIRIRASLQKIITCSKIGHYKLCFKHLTVVTKLLVQRFTANDCFFSP